MKHPLVSIEFYKYIIHNFQMFKQYYPFIFLSSCSCFRYQFFIYFLFSKILFLSFDYTELQSQQGMEFLEGFGKKKNQQQQHHLNNLSSIHINPLTAQPSLNIHLHGIFSRFCLFFSRGDSKKDSQKLNIDLNDFFFFLI